MYIKQAKTIPLSVILDKMNRVPQRTNGPKVLYFSVFREEKTPSLWIDTRSNLWRDFGDFKWQGGDTIHLVRGYLEYTEKIVKFSDALRWIRNMTNFIPPIKPVIDKDEPEPDKNIIHRANDKVSKDYLLEYGRSRGIPESVLQKFFKQATLYSRKKEKVFYALAMQNDWKGYDLRNKGYKGCVGKKYITFIRGTETAKQEGVNVFEGAFDFVTVVTQNDGKPLKYDSIILHSLSNLRKATAYIKNYPYRYCHTWMDNDEPGKQAVLSWEEFCNKQKGLIHVPMNEFYLPYKDVNAHHMAKLEL